MAVDGLGLLRLRGRLGTLGVVAANLMFDLDAVTIATQQRSSAGLWLGEVVATLGLVIVIFGSLRSGRTETIAFAVGGYITAAYWFTSSTSFANPAVTLARTLTDTFSGIRPGSAPAFVLAQAVGGALGYLLIRWLYPRPTSLAARVAADAGPDPEGRA